MDGSLRIRGWILRTWDAFTSKKYKFILRPQAHTSTWVEVERTRRMCPVYFDGSQFRTKLNITPITVHEMQKQLFNLCIVLALRSEEHTSELQSRENLVCRLLL